MLKITTPRTKLVPADLTNVKPGDTFFAINDNYDRQKFECDELTRELGTDDHIIAEPFRIKTFIALENNGQLVLWSPQQPLASGLPVNASSAKANENYPTYFADRDVVEAVLAEEDDATRAYYASLTDEQVLDSILSVWQDATTASPVAREVVESRIRQLKH